MGVLAVLLKSNVECDGLDCTDRVDESGEAISGTEPADVDVDVDGSMARELDWAGKVDAGDDDVAVSFFLLLLNHPPRCCFSCIPTLDILRACFATYCACATSSASFAKAAFSIRAISNSPAASSTDMRLLTR